MFTGLCFFRVYCSVILTYSKLCFYDIISKVTLALNVKIF